MANFWDWVNKQANNRYENRFTDAATGKGVGISKTDYSSPRSNNNQSGNLYAEAVAKNANSSSLQGTIDPDRTGAAAPPRKGLYDQTGMNAPAANAASGAIAGAMAGAGRLPKPDGAQQPTTTPTQPGTSGGGKVTYIDPNGDAQKGTTEGTPEETPGEPQRTYLDELRDQYQKMYDDAVKANNDAAKAAAERALAQAEKGVGELGDQYGSLNKQLYRDYMESLRVLPQEMAARGYSGGMSESARLGLDTAYGERLNENEAARIAAIMQLRQQGADAEYQANAARDQANAQAQQNLYANMMNLILQQQQDAAQKAQNMAQYGDFSGYLGLGYTQSEIDQMQKAWIAANPELARTLGYVKTPEPVYSSYSGGGSSGGGGGSVTVSTEGLQDAILGDLNDGKDRVAIWNDLASRYKAGDITEEQFRDAIHYTDYAATAKAYNKTPTSAGYKTWPGGKKK
ncbi:MAG: hypothetical protein KH332_09665 [Firmicutes bacterium]|nr:hypothetical protein [Bacillota bacterium]